MRIKLMSVVVHFGLRSLDRAADHAYFHNYPGENHAAELQEEVPLVEFMSHSFTCMPGEIYQEFRSQLCFCGVCQVLLPPFKNLLCWSSNQNNLKDESVKWMKLICVVQAFPLSPQYSQLCIGNGQSLKESHMTDRIWIWELPTCISKR